MLHGDLVRVIFGYLYGKHEQLLPYREKIIMYIQHNVRLHLNSVLRFLTFTYRKNTIINKPLLAYTEIIFDGLAYLVK